MRAKSLEIIVGNIASRHPAEMVQRFQKLRDCGALPISRGKNAEHLTNTQIVAGILSIVPIKIAHTMYAKSLLKLLPAGDENDSFFQSKNLEDAITKIIYEDDAYNSFLELRATTTQTIGYHSTPAASIIYNNSEGKEKTVYFIHEISRSNTPYNPRNMFRHVADETVYYIEIFSNIRRHIRDENEKQKIDTQIGKLMQ